MWRVQLFKLNYDEQEQQAVKEALDSAWLTMGQKTLDFEDAFSVFLGNDFKCLAVSNGTAALHMALLACGVGPGDEVITPALTFIADQNVTSFVGASNMLADITSMEDWSMDPQEIEKCITTKTKAVMIVHYAGYACDMDRIVDICRRRNLFLIEDCAHTPGADYKGQPLGTFGDVAGFSFFSNKNISVGEGGMAAAKNLDIYKNLKNLRSHGMTVPSFDRYKGRAVSYDIESPGLNYRIDEMRSALGLVQLKKLDAANQKRKELVNHYFSRLDAVPEITIPYRHFSRGTPNYHIMPILLAEKIDRNKVIESMKQDGVQTSIHYPAIQQFSAYKNRVNVTPRAEYVSAHELTLPLYPTMTFEEVDIVCDALLKGLS
ncbi:MAG: DegT/DnrJ/EryC1/StrS family aminotransferase [Treponema sp.]|jgi:dTDP-4-amino-4,6-dideoxygalactose transaminase|nr:DegT/DnrJ/EryC1/StrS family aminotransferase [Treponema sp.]